MSTSANLRIGVIGNQKITQKLIESLSAAGHELTVLITVGTEKQHVATDFCDLANLEFSEQTKVIETGSFDLNAALTKEHKALLASCDFVFVYGWQRLISIEILNLVRSGFFGVHGGPFPPPRCRGQAVLNWALIDGHKLFHMYLFRLDVEADSGSIFEERQFSIESSDDIKSLYNKSCYFCCEMFIEFAEKFKLGNFAYCEQDRNQTPTYLPKRIKKDGDICWQQDAWSIINLVRALTRPYPGAYSKVSGIEILIWSAKIFDTGHIFKSAPGEVIDILASGSILICTGNGLGICVDDYEIQKPFKIKKGMILFSPDAKPQRLNIY